jgi:hypothetical protein
MKKPVKNSHALLLGKGRRFKSGAPHQSVIFSLAEGDV